MKSSRPCAAMLALLACAFAAVTTQAQTPPAPSPAEQAIRYRQSLLFLMAWNLGPIGQMVQGKRPYDAAIVSRNAVLIAQLAPRLVEGFPPGSQTGATTRAKPEIWASQQDFRDKAAVLERVTTRLAEAAPGSDLARVTPFVTDVVDACKACHEKYRSD